MTAPKRKTNAIPGEVANATVRLKRAVTRMLEVKKIHRVERESQGDSPHAPDGLRYGFADGVQAAAGMNITPSMIARDAVGTQPAFPQVPGADRAGFSQTMFSRLGRGDDHSLRNASATGYKRRRRPARQSALCNFQMARVWV